jgi:hypothetical protein
MRFYLPHWAIEFSPWPNDSDPRHHHLESKLARRLPWAPAGILVSLGYDLFAAVRADDGRVTAQACGGAREMIAVHVSSRSAIMLLGTIMRTP